MQGNNKKPSLKNVSIDTQAKPCARRTTRAARCRRRCTKTERAEERLKRIVAGLRDRVRQGEAGPRDLWSRLAATEPRDRRAQGDRRLTEQMDCRMSSAMLLRAPALPHFAHACALLRRETWGCVRCGAKQTGAFDPKQ